MLEGLECISHDTRPEIMLLYLSGWLTCHHKHLSNPQLSCKELRRHKNANNKRTAKEAENEAEEKEKRKEKPRDL